MCQSIKRLFVSWDISIHFGIRYGFHIKTVSKAAAFFPRIINIRGDESGASQQQQQPLLELI